MRAAARPRFTSLAVLLFVAFLATANLTSRHVNDVAAAALASWRLGQFGDLDLSGFEDYGWISAVGDQAVSNRLPGAVIWGAPFYFLFGEGNQSVLPAAAAAAAAATAAAIVLWILLRRLASSRPALMATGLVLAGTAFWPVAADGLWTHGPASLFLLLGTLAVATGWWFGGGIAFAAAIMTRPHLAVVALVQGLWASVALRKWRPALLVGLGSAAGVVGLLVYNRIAFGGWSLLGGYADPDNLVRPDSIGDVLGNVAGTLVSPERGVLLLSPWLLLLLPGLRGGWRAAPAWARAAAASGLAYALTQLALNRFSGGDGFFGNRLMIEPLVLAAPLGLLAYYAWASRTAPRRLLFAVLAGYSITFHALAAVSNYIPLDARDPWRTWLQGELIAEANTWVVVPSLVVGVGLTAWAGARAWRGPSLVEHLPQGGDLPVPAPVGQHPGAASGAQTADDVAVGETGPHPPGDS